MADDLNFQLPPKGFQSYLDGILPLDQAVVAGAFAASMGQINNIQQVDLQRFAQVVYSLETNFGLPLTNGTDVPTDEFIVDSALTKVALGSGAYGTYTMSDFVGAMTGLPHNVKGIYEGIKQLETPTLTQIYQNLYLAVKWEQATATWDGSNFTYTNRGGGYGRGAGAPSVTVGGNPATATIGTDPNDLNNFGKIISISYSGPAGAVVIAAPPGPGWPGMNSVIQGYIDSANNEIFAIQTANDANFQASRALNANWDISGTALKIEQRSRYIAIPPVPVPYDKWLNLYPTSLYVFVDSIPDYAQNTLPHMAAQSLESIADYCSVGGQSLIGLMRQERNQKRLQEVGIDLYNNISDNISENQQKSLLTNGTLPNAADGIDTPAGKFTLPAWPNNTECNGPEIIPEPVSYYDPNIDALRQIEQTDDGNILTILNVTGPVAGGEPSFAGDPLGPIALINDDVIDIIPGEDGNFTLPPVIIVNPVVPIGIGNPILPPTQNEGTEGINLYPPEPDVVLTPNLDGLYTSTTLLPSNYNVNDAIDKVIECNCDCWVN